jgi:hypothetical protein
MDHDARLSKQSKKKRGETIYNVELERKLVTELNFEIAGNNLVKLAQLKEIATAEIVFDTIKNSLEVGSIKYLLL